MSRKIDSSTIKKLQLLRSQGLSLPKLKKKFNLGYGTIYKYVKDIEILPKYIRVWNQSYKSSTKRMQKEIKEADRKARMTVKKLSEREKILFLSALYWGEGTKKDLSLTNSDPDIIKIFTYCLRQYLNIPNERIMINIRFYEDMDKNECISFWLKETSLKRENISSINVLEGKRKGKLKYGICRMRVKKGGSVLKYLKAIQKEVIKQFSPYSSMDRTEVS